MKLVSRSKWGAKSANLSNNITPSGGGIAIHYVGGKGKLTPSSHSKCVGIVKSIERSHLNNKAEGYIAIAYNYLVCQHGYVFEGRGKNRRSGANGSSNGNQYYYAVCALVNESDSLADELIQGIKDICHYLRQSGGAGNKVVGHKNLYVTSCPGTKLYRHVTGGTFSRGKNNSKAYPGYLLKVGSRNRHVKSAQSRLMALGFKLPKWGADGVYGSETRSAVIKFQKSRKISADGIIGPITWGELF